MNNNIFIGGIVTHLAENSLDTFFICSVFLSVALIDILLLDVVDC